MMAHTLARIVDKLLQSPRQFVTSIEGRQGDQDIYPGSETSAVYGKDRGSGDEAEEGHSSERSHVNVFDRSLRGTSQRSIYRGRLVGMKDRSLLRPSLRCSRRSRTPASTMPSIASHRIHQPTMPRTESTIRT